VNFRYRPRGRGLPEGELDVLNRRIANRLVGSGSFLLAPTLIKGRASLRVCVVNFRTTEDDLRLLLKEAAAAGRELRAE
jgi:aromatic-L-amino-acid decarboxylase